MQKFKQKGKPTRSTNEDLGQGKGIILGRKDKKIHPDQIRRPKTKTKQMQGFILSYISRTTNER